jgi:hypothetical protein
MLRGARAMGREDIIAQLRQIESLVRDQRYELALALTTKVEDAIASLPADDATASRPLRDLLQASRLMTETLIRLRELRVH